MRYAWQPEVQLANYPSRLTGRDRHDTDTNDGDNEDFI